MPDLSRAQWHKSSYSNGSGDCAEVAHLPGDIFAVRNSKAPDAGTVFFTRSEMEAFLLGAKAGEFDDLPI
jgi:hypothetical protein